MSLPEAADLYQDIVMRHARAPQHRRPLAACDGQADGDNPLCGDRVHVQIRRDDSGRIAECGFDARGCAISLASADMMADAVLGLDAGDVAALHGVVLAMLDRGDPGLIADRHAELRALSGVAAYRSRIKCATLPWAALRAAIDGRNHATSEGAGA